MTIIILMSVVGSFIGYYGTGAVMHASKKVRSRG